MYFSRIEGKLWFKLQLCKDLFTTAIFPAERLNTSFNIIVNGSIDLYLEGGCIFEELQKIDHCRTFRDILGQPQPLREPKIRINDMNTNTFYSRLHIPPAGKRCCVSLSWLKHIIT